MHYYKLIMHYPIRIRIHSFGDNCSRDLVNHHLHVCGQAGHAAGVGRGVARVPRLRPLLRLLHRPLLRLQPGAVPAGAGRVGGRGGGARVRQVPGVVPRAGLLVPTDTLQPH